MLSQQQCRVVPPQLLHVVRAQRRQGGGQRVLLCLGLPRRQTAVRHRVHGAAVAVMHQSLDDEVL